MSRLQIARAWLTHRLRRFDTRAALERHQRQHAQAMVRHAYARSPFYRARLTAPTLEALRAMRPIDKALMMANFDALNTAGVRLDEALHVALRAEQDRDFRPQLRGFTVGLSSGTSGSRGLFLVSEQERWEWAGAVLERMLPHSLIGPRRDRIALFLRANSNLYEALDSRRVRFRYFDLLEPIEAMLPRLSELSPTLLVGPPSLLVALAAAQEHGRISLAPERVVSVAEVLEPLDEARLRRAFRCTVHQIYQATEGLLGTTCAYGTVHLAEDLALFEREYLDAERTRFVPIVTDLFRTTQPILRYRLDDVLVERRERCLCGSVLTGLARIEGRADDVFLIDVGKNELRPLYPDFVRRAVIVAAPEVRNYHVRQRAPCELELHLDVAREHGAARQRVHGALAELFVQQGSARPRITDVTAPSAERGTKLRRIERTFAGPARGST